MVAIGHSVNQFGWVLSDWEADELTVFAVYPNRKFLPPKVRSFIDFLAERFGPEPYWDFDTK